jgi:hypothetical protein
LNIPPSPRPAPRRAARAAGRGRNSRPLSGSPVASQLCWVLCAHHRRQPPAHATHARTVTAAAATSQHLAPRRLQLHLCQLALYLASLPVRVVGRVGAWPSLRGLCARDEAEHGEGDERDDGLREHNRGPAAARVEHRREQRPDSRATGVRAIPQRAERRALAVGGRIVLGEPTLPRGITGW